MKKIIFIMVVSLSIFLIYFFNKDTSIYYLALGDKNEYINELGNSLKKIETKNINFLLKENTNKKIYNQISHNVLEKNQRIKNALIKADIVTIYLNYEYLDKSFESVDKESVIFEKMLKVVSKNCKEKIIIIGPDDEGYGYLKYLNKKFRNISFKYNIKYVKISDENLIDEIIGG